jgi:hypothetical protein
MGCDFSKGLFEWNYQQQSLQRVADKHLFALVAPTGGMRNESLA